MYAKLAWRNMRRSLRDYGIYFMTLVFAVAIFYVFNSIGEQPAYLSLAESKRRMGQATVQMLEWVTTIMTGVVALLVLYANRVIVKKRNRELGTYLLLGMEQGRLSLLLLAEIAVISLAALGVGLAGGVALSQAFALVVNRVFGASPQGHGIIFSASSALRTLLYYGIMFILVGLLQAGAVYKQRLIDLINGVRKNEEIRLRSRPLALTAGLLGAAALGWAYWLSDRVSRTVGLDPTDPRILIGAVLGIAGTYLLFLALAGLLTGIRRKQGGWLSRGLNLFLYRQVTSKINTNAALLATIALMLTFTICAMSAGLGIGALVRMSAERDAPFDYALFSTQPEEEFEEILTLFDQYGVTDRHEVRFQAALAEVMLKELMLPVDAAWFAADVDSYAMYVADSPVRVIPFSAYRALRALKGYAPVDLPADAYLLHATDLGGEVETHVRTAFQRFQASGATVTIAGSALRPAAQKVFTEPLGYDLLGGQGLLVVPDAAAASLEPRESYLMMEVGQPVPEALEEAAEGVRDAFWSGEYPGYFGFTSQSRVVGSVYMVEGILVFFSFYTGIMFILISATLLALQQVTDAVEHRQRFEVLRKLGADESMVDGTIARQVGLYFLVPLAVAIVHSVAALLALNRLLTGETGYGGVWSAFLVTMAILAAIYGAYYLLSLQTCRGLFKQQQAW